MTPSYAGATYSKLAKVMKAARPIGCIPGGVPVRRAEESLFDVSRWFRRAPSAQPAVERAAGTMQTVRTAEPVLERSASPVQFAPSRMNVRITHVDRPIAGAGDIVERSLTKGFAY